MKISIILTSYNHSQFLRESIESVLNQTFPDFELIIWDDASTDNSWEIIQSYEDPRIIAYRNKINLGGRTISRAIKEVAVGEYIAIQHSDDAWEPSKLEKQIAYLDNNLDVAAVFTLVQVINEDGKPFTDKNNFYYDVFDQPNRDRFGWLRHFFYHGNALCHPSLLIRKTCYRDISFRNGMNQLPDFNLWVQLCMKYEIHILQEKLVRFRVRKDEANQSGSRPEARIRRQFELFKTLSEFKKIETTEELIKIFPEAKQYIHQDCADIHFALGMVATEQQLDNPTSLFGLDLLFEALNDRDRAPALEKHFGFNKKSFIKLSGKYDIFSFEKIRDLNSQKLSILNINKGLLKNNTGLKKFIRELKKNNRELGNQITRLEKNNQELIERNTALAKNNQDLIERNTTLAKNNRELEKNIRELTGKITDLERNNSALEQEVLFYASSKSWQITRPLRKLRKLLRGDKNV